jgi:hypothetical protein
MPSKSKKQHNLMAAVANNPKFAKKVGIPQSVGEDYVEADKGRKFRSGGMAGCGTKRMKVGGKVGMHKMPDGTMMKDSEHKMAMGGMAMGAGKGYKAGGSLEMVEKGGKKVPFYAADGKGKMAMGGKVMGYKKGGGVTRGDGACMKGHTKGRMV